MVDTYGELILFTWRCCVNRLRSTLLVWFFDLDSVALWHPELGHAIEGGTAQEQLVGLHLKVAGPQGVAKEGLQIVR